MHYTWRHSFSNSYPCNSTSVLLVLGKRVCFDFGLKQFLLWENWRMVVWGINLLYFLSAHSIIYKYRKETNKFVLAWIKIDSYILFSWCNYLKSLNKVIHNLLFYLFKTISIFVHICYLLCIYKHHKENSMDKSMFYLRNKILIVLISPMSNIFYLNTWQIEEGPHFLEILVYFLLFLF